MRAFGRQSGYENGALMNGIRAFIKEIPLSSLGFLPCEDTAICEPGNRPRADTESASGSILEFPAFRIARNKCSLFNPPDCDNW